MTLHTFPESLDECALLEKRLSTTISSLQVQLNAAKSDAASSGNFADNAWFIRTTSALKHKRREHQLLKEHMGKIRKAETKRSNLSFSNVLIEVLKEQVSKSVFDACILEAKHRVELERKS